MYDQLIEAAQVFCDHIMDLKRYPEPAGLTAPKIVAHRGCWDMKDARENSLPAFQRAASLGAWGIEFDVHFTLDNAPVVIHDPDLRRTHKKPGLLRELNVAKLKDLQPPVPMLDQVLALRGLHFMIEIKTNLNALQLDVLTSALRNLEPVRDYHLLALKTEFIKVTPAIPPEAWMLVAELNVDQMIQHAIKHRLGAVSGHYLFMTRSKIERLHQAGIKAGVGFPPSRNLFRREWGRQVDWVFTNSLPELLK